MASPLNGLVEATIKGQPTMVEYEPDTELRDTEQIPLLHEGGIKHLLGKGGSALRARRLVLTGAGEDRVRDQLHSALLQAETDEDAGADPGRHTGLGAGDRGATGRDSLMKIGCREPSLVFSHTRKTSKPTGIRTSRTLGS